MAPDLELDRALDATLLVPYTEAARRHLEPIRFHADIDNVNRCVGTMLGHEVTAAHPEGLPDSSITVDCTGAGGQSFGAFLPKGVTLNIEGDANDYLARASRAASSRCARPSAPTISSTRNIIVGNVAFYGATAARASSNGLAGQPSPCATPAPPWWSKAWATSSST